MCYITLSIFLSWFSIMLLSTDIGVRWKCTITAEEEALWTAALCCRQWSESWAYCSSAVGDGARYNRNRLSSAASVCDLIPYSRNSSTTTGTCMPTWQIQARTCTAQWRRQCDIKPLLLQRKVGVGGHLIKPGRTTSTSNTRSRRGTQSSYGWSLNEMCEAVHVCVSVMMVLVGRQLYTCVERTSAVLSAHRK